MGKRQRPKLKHARQTKPIPSLAKVTTIPRKLLQPGTVVYASLDYDDGSGHKIRPVVVVAASASEVQVRGLYSKPRLGARKIVRNGRVCYLAKEIKVIPRSDLVNVADDVVELEP